MVFHKKFGAIMHFIPITLQGACELVIAIGIVISIRDILGWLFQVGI